MFRALSRFALLIRESAGGSALDGVSPNGTLRNVGECFPDSRIGLSASLAITDMAEVKHTDCSSAKFEINHARVTAH